MSPKQNLTDKDMQAIDDLIKMRIEENNDVLTDKIGLKQDRVITMLQELMGEVQTEREENTILENRSSENRLRIERIESHLKLSPDT